jgi:hypothetical protein
MSNAVRKGWYKASWGADQPATINGMNNDGSEICPCSETRWMRFAYPPYETMKLRNYEIRRHSVDALRLSTLRNYETRSA